MSGTDPRHASAEVNATLRQRMEELSGVYDWVSGQTRRVRDEVAFAVGEGQRDMVGAAGERTAQGQARDQETGGLEKTAAVEDGGQGGGAGRHEEVGAGPICRGRARGGPSVSGCG